MSDRFDNTPLHVACERGYHAIALTLIEAGADVDNKNEDERTPLHLAAKEGRVRYRACFCHFVACAVCPTALSYHKQQDQKSKDDDLLLTSQKGGEDLDSQFSRVLLMFWNSGPSEAWLVGPIRPRAAPGG